MSQGLPVRSDGGPLVKICGLRRVEDLVAAREAGSDLIGLIFAPSRRRLTVAQAAALREAVPESPPTVGVFVDAPVAEMNATAAAVGLNLVQLSGTQVIPDGSLTVPYLKVLHIREGDRAETLLAGLERFADAAAFLVDAWSPQGGGAGITPDWQVAATVVRHATRPVLLAGGLIPANVAQGLLATGAAGADVSSGVERDGSKDATLIAAFIRAARAARQVAGPRPEPATRA